MRNNFIVNLFWMLKVNFQHRMGLIKYNETEITEIRKFCISNARFYFRNGNFSFAQSWLHALRERYRYSSEKNAAYRSIDECDPELLYFEAICNYLSMEYLKSVELLKKLLFINPEDHNSIVLLRWIRLTCELRRIRSERLPPPLDKIVNSSMQKCPMGYLEIENECARLLSIGDVKAAQQQLQVLLSRCPTYGSWECEVTIIERVNKGKRIIFHKADVLSYGKRWITNLPS